MISEIITGKRNMSIGSWTKTNKINPGFASNLYKALDEPDDAPFLLKAMTDAFSEMKKPARGEIREALIRVQVYCSIHGNSDPIKISKQLFISQTLERLMFGSNLLLTEGFEEEEEPKKAKK